MEEKLLDLIKDVLEIEDRDIYLSDVFRDYEEWDSIANLTLIACIDEEFEVIISSNELKELHTIQDILQKIQSSQR
jgi:acyl carrier protein